MRRSSFLTLAAVAALAARAPRARLAAGRVRSVARVARADRSLLEGSFGAGCASRRRANARGGYTFAELV